MNIEVVAKPKSNDNYSEIFSLRRRVYTLSLTNIPIILALLLNNEPHIHSSVEPISTFDDDDKSLESGTCKRWFDFSKELLGQQRPELSAKDLQKEATKIANYMLSVFTEAYNMTYTVSMAQIKIFIICARNFIEDGGESYRLMSDNFYAQTVSVLEEYLSLINTLFEIDELPDSSLVFSLFAMTDQPKKAHRISSGGFEWTFTRFLECQQDEESLQIDFYENQFPLFHIPTILGKASSDSYINWWIESMSNLLRQGSFPQGCVIKVYKIE